MGYETGFEGRFDLDKPLEIAQAEYLFQLSQTRRMKRIAKIAEKDPDPVRKAVGLPIGDEAAYFVGGTGFKGQDRDHSIADYNEPPSVQPSLWLHWSPTEDREGIAWDNGSTFYNYIEWLEYIVEHFLEPWGYTLSGRVDWQGEDEEDKGFIQVIANKVYVNATDIEILAAEGVSK